MAGAQWAERLTPEEIIDFFTKVRANGKCPACEVTQWIVPQNEIERLIVLSAPDKDGNYIPAASVIPTIIVFCGNCGFVRSHAFAKVWMTLRGTDVFAETPSQEKKPENG